MTVSDLIKRQDAIDALNECEDIKGYAYTQMHDAIMEIPSVDIPHSDDWEKYSERLWQKAYERGKADRPQGEWIDRGMRVPCSWVKKCSLCGHETDTWRWCKFCPNCGARMKGADDEH